MGKRGSVDAILMDASGVWIIERQQLQLSRDRKILCFKRVREKEVRAHITVKCPGSAQRFRLQASEYGNWVLSDCRGVDARFLNVQDMSNLVHLAEATVIY
jgi:hypothetical protein